MLPPKMGVEVSKVAGKVRSSMSADDGKCVKMCHKRSVVADRARGRALHSISQSRSDEPQLLGVRVWAIRDKV